MQHPSFCSESQQDDFQEAVTGGSWFETVHMAKSTQQPRWPQWCWVNAVLKHGLGAAVTLAGPHLISLREGPSFLQSHCPSCLVPAMARSVSLTTPKKQVWWQMDQALSARACNMQVL